MKKIKVNKKKLIVLSVMVVLLVTTGVLNWVLGDRITFSQQSGDTSVTAVETFFSAYRTDRSVTREEEFVYLDAIISSENTSAQAKSAAESQKLALVERMESELSLETGIKAFGFDEAVVTMNSAGVTVVVNAESLSVEDSAKILSVITESTSFKPADVNIIPYN